MSVRFRSRPPACRRLSAGVLGWCLLVTGALADDTRDSAGRYYENAVQRYHQGDFEGAIIQLKNALQAESRMLPALALMGETYVAMGRGAAAERALREAQAAGADASLTAVPLARSYLLQFKHDAMLAERIPPDLPANKRAELLEIKARAALQINELPTLRRILEETDRIAPESVVTASVRATLALRKGDYAEAAQQVERALRFGPDSALAWLTSASLAHARGDSGTALEAYAKVLELDPENVDARLARAGLLLDLGRDAETEPDFLALSADGALDPRVAYLRAVKLGRAGDSHGTRSALNEAVNLIDALGTSVVSRNSQLLMLAGVVNYGLGNHEAARAHLEEYVRVAGGEQQTRQMLASVMLQQHDYRPAVQVLEKLLETAPPTPRILALLARGYTGLGEHARAASALEDATALAPEDTALATDFALARARRGEVDAALAQLADIFAADGDRGMAGLPLAVLHMNRQDYAAAIEVARSLGERQPDDATVQNLLAVALIGDGQFDAGRTLLQELLTRDPDYVAADMNLGKLERREGQLEQAQARFTRLLERRPDDGQLLLELARTAQAMGDNAAALEWAGRAAKAAPRSLEIARYEVDLHLSAGDIERAREVADAQARRHRDNLYVMETQARVLFAAGDESLARPLLERMAARAGTDPDWLYRTAAIQFDFNLFADARKTLSTAVDAHPMRPESRALLAATQLALGDVDDAATVADELVRDFPRFAGGHGQLGDVLTVRGRHDEAARSYARALEVAARPLPEVALKQHLALRRAGQAAAATRVLEAWLERFPDDHWARGALAEHAQQHDRLEDARGHYEAFLRAVPGHAPSLNNLANVRLALGDVAGALAAAREAQAQAPSEPLYNDTLGWILVQADQTDEALRFLREARARAALVPEISYHLAVALHRQQRDDEALVVLREALSEGSTFAGRPDAERLAAELAR